jgi:hypothetical protein
MVNSDETLAPIFEIPSSETDKSWALKAQILINYEPLMRFAHCYLWWAVGQGMRTAPCS